MIALLFVYRCDLWIRRVAFALAFAQAYGVASVWRLFIIQKYNQPQYPQNGGSFAVLRRAYCVLRVLRTADERHNTAYI